MATLAAAATDKKNKNIHLLNLLSNCERDVGLSDAATKHAAMCLVRNPIATAKQILRNFPRTIRRCRRLVASVCAEYPAEKEADSLGRLQRLLAAGDPPAGWDDEIRKLAARATRTKRTNRANRV